VPKWVAAIVDIWESSLIKRAQAHTILLLTPLKDTTILLKDTPTKMLTPNQAQALTILLLTPLKDITTLLKDTTTLLKDTPTKILTLKVTMRVMETELSTLHNYNYTKMKL